MLNLRVKKLREDAIIPTRNNPSDAGLDLYTVDGTMIPWGASYKFSTGIAVAIPNGYVGLIFDRSSVGNKGLSRLAGVIDSNYRGEIQVLLANVAGQDYVEVLAGDKIAQLIIIPIPVVEVTEVEELDNTDRSDKGFGSSGR